MREPSLNETDAPPRRRSLPLATQQKSFLCFSWFAHAGFFLLKGKENFFAGFCSQRAGRRAWPLLFARTRRNSLHTPPSASPSLWTPTEFVPALAGAPPVLVISLRACLDYFIIVLIICRISCLWFLDRMPNIFSISKNTLMLFFEISK